MAASRVGIAGGDVAAVDGLGDHVAEQMHRVQGFVAETFEKTVLGQHAIGETVGLFIGILAEAGDDWGDLIGNRRVRLVRPGQRSGQAGIVKMKDFPGQLILALEMAIERSFRELACPGDVLDRGAVDALAYEQSQGLGRNPHLGIGSFALHGLNTGSSGKKENPGTISAPGSLS